MNVSAAAPSEEKHWFGKIYELESLYGLLVNRGSNPERTESTGNRGFETDRWWDSGENHFD